MLLAGNCISYAGPFSDISPICVAAIARSSEEEERSRADVGAEASASFPISPTKETGTSPVTKTTLFLEVDRPDTMTVSPLWVNSHDSTSPRTPSSAFPGSSYSKAVKTKAAMSSLSGGNFRRSVFVSCCCVRVCVRVQRRNRRSHRHPRPRCPHRRRVFSRCVQPTARYQRRVEDVLVVVAFFALRESLGLINCFGSLFLANSC